MESVIKLGGGQFVVNGESVYRDLDYPAAADELGFGLKRPGEECRHRGTDGTVDCPDCGKSQLEFIAEAGAFLERQAVSFEAFG